MADYLAKDAIHYRKLTLPRSRSRAVAASVTEDDMLMVIVSENEIDCRSLWNSRLRPRPVVVSAVVDEMMLVVIVVCEQCSALELGVSGG
jgi:hypothetical protein